VFFNDEGYKFYQIQKGKGDTTIFEFGPTNHETDKKDDNSDIGVIYDLMDE
jgi:hypothetical protein